MLNHLPTLYLPTYFLPESLSHDSSRPHIMTKMPESVMENARERTMIQPFIQCQAHFCIRREIDSIITG